MNERDVWDRRHGTSRPPAPPSVFVEKHARALYDRRPTGRALDLACGSGRHTRLLTRLGFPTVVALDFSRNALAQAAPAGGAALGVGADATRLPFREGSFDLVIQACFLERSLFPVLGRLLAPGGVLVAETFAVAQFEATGHPRREYCLEPGELERLCRSPAVGLEIDEALDGSRRTDGNPRHLSAVAAHRP